MGRNIRDFKGDNVVIGCSHTNKHLCQGKCHSPRSAYYAIDFNAGIQPDLTFDLRSALPAQLQGRFKLTLIENVDFTAYNNPPTQQEGKNGYKGFENAMAMTHDDGFVFIIGCPREKEFRNSIKNLKYIEIGRDSEENGCVIIPKNQTLDIFAIREKIKSSLEILRVIEQLNETTYIPADQELDFCKLPYDSMPTTHDARSRPLPPPEENENSPVTAHRNQFAEIERLYQAIDNLHQHGQQNIVRDEFSRNSILDFATKLKRNADNFFKHPTPVIQRDIANFQKKFGLLLHKNDRDFIRNKKDVLLLIANIALALTGLGAIAVAAKVIHSRVTCGRYFPLFFENTNYQKLIYAADKASQKVKPLLHR